MNDTICKEIPMLDGKTILFLGDFVSGSPRSVHTAIEMFKALEKEGARVITVVDVESHYNDFAVCVEEMKSFPSMIVQPKRLPLFEDGLTAKVTEDAKNAFTLLINRNVDDMIDIQAEQPDLKNKKYGPPRVGKGGKVRRW